ncbi:unnamed protein product [Caenorhabditis nigoni]
MKTWKVAPSEPKAREKIIWRRRGSKRSKRNIGSSRRAETILNDYNTEKPCQSGRSQSNADRQEQRRNVESRKLR